MAKMTFLRGASGSGKSTEARKMQFLLSEGIVNVNRDSIRSAFFGREGVLEPSEEALITQIQRTAALGTLKAGRNVICDDTNLRAAFLKDWLDLLVKEGHEYEIFDIYASLDDCLKRNQERCDKGGRFVPPEAIRGQFKRYNWLNADPAVKPWPEVHHRLSDAPSRLPYTPDEDLREIILCDLDGTIADFSTDGFRGPFDLDVSRDRPIKHVVDMVRNLHWGESFQIIFLSGRKEGARQSTTKWIDDHVGLCKEYELFMRGDDDNRPDDQVKYDLFNEHIRGRYNVAAVFDDRPRVLKLWSELGLPTFAVGKDVIYGNDF